jgi:hypothetical protein
VQQEAQSAKAESSKHAVAFSFPQEAKLSELKVCRVCDKVFKEKDNGLFSCHHHPGEPWSSLQKQLANCNLQLGKAQCVFGTTGMSFACCGRGPDFPCKVYKHIDQKSAKK